MKAGREIIYWDACIFLAWLKNELCAPGVMEGIEENVRQIHENEAALVTSIMTQTEVLESRMSKDAQTKFENLFMRRNVVWINHDTRIGKLSHDIRAYYDQKSIVLSSPDSIHLASAILYDVSVMYTLDGSGKKKRGHLLPLNGNVAGHKLKIETPFKSQLSLRFEAYEEQAEEKKDEKQTTRK